MQFFSKKFRKRVENEFIGNIQFWKVFLRWSIFQRTGHFLMKSAFLWYKRSFWFEKGHFNIAKALIDVIYHVEEGILEKIDNY